LTILSVAGRYKQLVQYGRESAHKSMARGAFFPTWSLHEPDSARRRMRSSAGPERSQQLQILPGLNNKAFLQWVCLLFLLRQHFNGHQYFSRRQVFGICQRFWLRHCFWIHQVFWMRQCFFIYFAAPIFLVYSSAFLFSMRQ